MQWLLFIDAYLLLKHKIYYVLCRNDEWNSDRPKDDGDRKYDGPAGMEPDGVIDSNWDEVGIFQVWILSPVFVAQVCENFDDMLVKEELRRGINAYGFEKPYAIQQRAIVPCLKVR